MNDSDAGAVGMYAIAATIVNVSGAQFPRGIPPQFFLQVLIPGGFKSLFSQVLILQELARYFL
jgi:hypothetical protein